MSRVLVVDLDVHQGDGTHAAFRDDPETFTFSVNGFGNYPFRRVPGDLELDLPDGTADDGYLEASHGSSPRRSRARAPSSASTSPAPTRTSTTGSGDWR